MSIQRKEVLLMHFPQLFSCELVVHSLEQLAPCLAGWVRGRDERMGSVWILSGGGRTEEE